MRICCVHEGLFPAIHGAARHVESLIRRLGSLGHEVSALTTRFEGAKDPGGLLVLRVPDLDPGTEGQSGTDSETDLIARHLTGGAPTLVILNGDSPFSEAVLDRALADQVPTLLRITGFSGDPSRRLLSMARRAAAVIATTPTNAESVGAALGRSIPVSPEGVDTNVFRAGRTTRRDLESLLGRFDAKGRRVVLVLTRAWSSSFVDQLGRFSEALERESKDVRLLVLDESRGAAEGIPESGSWKVLARPLPRERFAAMDAADCLVVLPDQEIDPREALEFFAMRCPLACDARTSARLHDRITKDDGLVILPFESMGTATAALNQLVTDRALMEELQERALSKARRCELNSEIEEIERVGLRLLPGAGGEERGAQAVSGLQTQRPKAESSMNGRDGVPGHDPEEHENHGRDDGHQSDANNGRPPRDDGRGPDRESTNPAGGPLRPEKEPEIVWTAEDAASSTTRFDPDSEDGFEPIDSDDEGGAQRDDGSGRNRDRDRRRRRRGGRGGPDVQELGASSGIDVVEIQHDRRSRKGGVLEPGLTLKDLMPFLRPPKTVLILGASTGNGHNRTAAALAEAFKGIDRNLIVREADVLELTEKTYRSTYLRTLLEDLSRNPSVFGAPFETVDPAADQPLPTELDEVVAQAFGERIDQIVVDRRPDHLVCTHWLPLKHFEALKEQQRLSAPVTVLIPEPDLHPRWISSCVGHYLVTHENVRARLVKHGIDPTLISGVPAPVSPAFIQPIDRDQAYREMGLRHGIPTILLRPGGIGATERIIAVATSLMEAVGPINLLVVGGKNERLKDELSRLEPTRGSVVRSFGFVDNIRDLMGASDLLITRASPHTVAEALAAGLPMVLLRPSPGVEERTADRVLARGLALKAYGEDDFDHVIRELFARGRKQLSDLAQAAARERSPDGAIQAAERIARIVK